jgi:hypothetical protein
MISPKTRWRNHSNFRTTSFAEVQAQAHKRMDATYYIAKDVLIAILDELRHDTSPTIEGFMENIDFMLEHPALINAAKQVWATAEKESKVKEHAEERRTS